MQVEQTTPLPKTTSGDWWFRGAALITIVWFGFLVALIAFRVADYWPLFEPKPTTSEATSTRLTLNEIGDFLAGSFAPLAFLWFFVSTWLQREELKETRQVLADQQKELRTAAKESAEQTAIMQRQLQTAQEREVFEEHRLRLYYLAKYILSNSGLSFTYWKDGDAQAQQIINPISNFEFEQSDEAVDFVLTRFRDTINSIPNIPSIAIVEISGDFRRSLEYIYLELDHLVWSDRYASNSLVQARIRGANLLSIYARAKDASSSVGVE
ncbi:hypothetical protein DC522_05850 [Microvirga sp. KLBC 81]|uniref:hypothetical protein n=1 Tax=Microvirga sp. KLBC 81 TaxID=1862707 RepID=UPI000D521385|nr:hypothetical protein [Microvirga sp. KLBC 81]PVE25417.1 hypothetical protein DC522_05850 [Microvirga sp. KLBC 81]